MRKFSDRFPTFFDWLEQASNSNYSKRITKLHFWYPDATLEQLSGRKKLPTNKLPFHLVDPRGLNAKEKSQRIDAISVLNRIRHGENPNSVIVDARISKKELQKHLGRSIKFQKNSIDVSKSDKIPRSMIISEDGNEISVIVRGSSQASKIGRYQNAKRNFLQTGDDSKLEEFSKVKLKDADGKIHKFETNPEKIIEIEDKKEEAESFEIYTDR